MTSFFNNCLVVALSIIFYFHSANSAYAKSTNGDIRPIAISEFDFSQKRKSKYTGFILLNLNVSGVAPSFDFYKTKIGLEDVSTKFFAKKVKKRGIRKDKRVNLQGLEPGYYVMPLTEGVYQISKVNAPYFDLPYIQDTDQDSRWRFRVYPKSLNYIGKLTIEKARGTKFVDTSLQNRFVTDYDNVVPLAQKHAPHMPLRSSLGIDDPLESMLLEVQGGEK